MKWCQVGNLAEPRKTEYAASLRMEVVAQRDVGEAAENPGKGRWRSLGGFQMPAPARNEEEDKAMLTRCDVEALRDDVEHFGGIHIDSAEIKGRLVTTCLHHMAENRWRQEKCGTCKELNPVGWPLGWPPEDGVCGHTDELILRAEPACGCWKEKE